VDLIRNEISFDRDVTISVFETTIRVLGGLLSAHVLLADKVVPEAPESWAYDDELLHLAEDLAERLLPAFETETGIPYHRVNLRHGVERSESRKTCTAAAGTLLVEFGVLSRLTGRRVFEDKARTALFALWERRNPSTGLVGNTINVQTGQWLLSKTGSGPGVDSFFEYLQKASVLLDHPASPFYRENGEFIKVSDVPDKATPSHDGDITDRTHASSHGASSTGRAAHHTNNEKADNYRAESTSSSSSRSSSSSSRSSTTTSSSSSTGGGEGASAPQALGSAFEEAVRKVDEHLSFGPWHIEVDMNVGRDQPLQYSVSALQAFWPGLLASTGRLEAASESFDAFYSLWRNNRAMPEEVDLLTRSTTYYGKGYYLRPELAESAMVLYHKTREAKYVRAAARIMRDIETRCRVACGYATLRSVHAKQDGFNREDRMDSYFIAETLKYLYLTFDMAARNSTQISTLGESPIFSTEGHLFFLKNASVFDHLSSSLSASPLDDPLSPKPALNSSVAGATCPGHQGGPSTTTTTPSRDSQRPEFITARVNVESVLTPYISAPVQVPAGHSNARRSDFVLAPAAFGRAVAGDLEAHVILVKAEPLDSCDTIRNSEEILRAQKLASDLRLSDGRSLAVAVVAARGGCSFVHKVANIANATLGRVETVIIVNRRADGDELHTMVDDGTLHQEGPLLGYVRGLMAPYSFMSFFKQIGFPIMPGLPHARAYHQSHYAVAHLAGARRHLDSKQSPRGAAYSDRSKPGQRAPSQAPFVQDFLIGEVAKLFEHLFASSPATGAVKEDL